MTYFKSFTNYLKQYHVLQTLDIISIIIATILALLASSAYLTGYFAFFAILSGTFIYYRQIYHQAS